MDNTDILKATSSTQRLVQNEDYYKYIFKKTEKIVSVVFYIAHNVQKDNQEAPELSDVLESARRVHNAVLSSLEVRAHVAEEAMRTTAHALIVLESKLRVGQATGLLAPDVLHVLTAEIDAVLRGLNKYLKQSGAFDDTAYTIAPTRETVSSSTNIPARTTRRTSTRPVATSDGLDRRERIKTVLDAKGEATIKDIASVVTDCSEKTIQRELNAMIEDNIVKRHGERRWSRYSLF
jgi:hypothetical protein